MISLLQRKWTNIDAPYPCTIPSHVAPVLASTNGLEAVNGVHLVGFAAVIPFPQAGLFVHFEPSLSPCGPQVPAVSSCSVEPVSAVRLQLPAVKLVHTISPGPATVPHWQPHCTENV